MKRAREEEPSEAGELGANHTWGPPTQADREAAINMLPNADPTTLHSCDACNKDITGVSERQRGKQVVRTTICIVLWIVKHKAKSNEQREKRTLIFRGPRSVVLCLVT